MPIAQPIAEQKPPGYFRGLPLLKKLFWLYFLLLIFEGALRKWVAPQLSAPLLIIRDPVGIWIVWEAYRTHKWPRRWAGVIALLTILFVGLFTVQLVYGDNPWIAGLYGLRSYLLPFPVLFILGENLDERDLRKFGAFTLWILLPMTVLEVAQYISPSNSFLNRGAYEGGGQIGFAGTHVRASGTFSLNTGPVELDLLAAAFLLYSMGKEGFGVKTWLLWASGFALILSTPMTGARGLVFQLAAMMVCVGVGAMMGISQFAKAFRIILPLLILSFLVSLLPVFQDAAGLLIGRFEGATQGAEGDPIHSLMNRTVQPILDTFDNTNLEGNLIGIGIGRGAIAVNALMQGETIGLEGDNLFARELMEMGSIAGLIYALLKVVLSVVIIGNAIARMGDREPLALLLVPMSVSGLLFTTPEYATAQGFMVISTGFAIAASMKSDRLAEQEQIHPVLLRQGEFRRRRPERVSPN